RTALVGLERDPRGAADPRAVVRRARGRRGVRRACGNADGHAGHRHPVVRADPRWRRSGGRCVANADARPLAAVDRRVLTECPFPRGGVVGDDRSNAPVEATTAVTARIVGSVVALALAASSQLAMPWSWNSLRDLGSWLVRPIALPLAWSAMQEAQR